MDFTGHLVLYISTVYVHLYVIQNLIYCYSRSIVLMSHLTKFNAKIFTRQFFYNFHFQELIHEHTYMAVNFHEELQKWADYDYYEENVHKLQLPFTLVSMYLIYFI